MHAQGRLLSPANCFGEYSPRLAASWRHVPSAPYFLWETVNTLMFKSVYLAG